LKVAGLYFPQELLSPALETLRSEVRDFVTREREAGNFSPICDSWNAGFSPDFSRELGRRGWLGMTWPKKYGGHERSAIERFVVVEELLAAGAPVAAHWIADRQTGPMLLKYGTEQQRQRFLPPIAAGECYFAIGMSEPDSGSDLASVQTRAIRSGAGWRVSGRKIWTSHAHRAHYFILLCRTSPRGEERHAGLSQLIVDLSTPGVMIRPVVSMSGEHHFNEVILDEVDVADEMVVGGVGDGWRQVTSELAFERSGPERFLSTFQLLVQLIESVNRDISEQQSRVIGSILARLSFVRKLSMAVALAIEEGREPITESALVKDVGTRLEQDMIEATRSALIRSPSSESAEALDSTLCQAILASPGFTLRGGTTEILRMIISKGLHGW
jgi:alkylation response protein AidB-like acyl-CoA dehydrogenase